VVVLSGERMMLKMREVTMREMERPMLMEEGLRSQGG
jgi:hypothetical protein